MDHLVDVGGVIADAFAVLGDEQQVRDLADAVGIADHVGDQRAEQAFVEIVDRAIAFGDVERGGGIARGEGIEPVIDYQFVTNQNGRKVRIHEVYLNTEEMIGGTTIQLLEYIPEPD